MVARVDGTWEGMVNRLDLVDDLGRHRRSWRQETRCVQRQWGIQPEEGVKGTVLVFCIVAAVLFEAGRVSVLAVSLVAVSNGADGRSVTVHQAVTY